MKFVKKNIRENEQLVSCFGCGIPIKVDASPVSINMNNGRILKILGIKVEVIIPRLTAPFVCSTCRLDKKQFKIVRRAMMTLFGWNKESEEGVLLEELSSE